MGVAGLWEVLRPAGRVRSLTELAVEDGFNASSAHHRGFRIGIDASIWFFHAAYGREGENPELRMLFFRCCRLLQSPLLPLFVFDGPNRPATKRGKRVGGNAHWLTQGMKNIIDAFGFEWWVAPGEAEAELAYLNRVGVVDAVLSDDVDNFLFGAPMVIRNPSNTLSGNRAHPVKNAQGKDDGNHVVTYTAESVLSDPSVALSRPGTILIGLLSGGDYIPAGLPGCGQKFATGLARAGFGDSLVKAVKEVKGARLDAFLDQWRQDIRNELKTNKSGFLPSKKPSLAASLPDDFPSLPVLMSYADPLTSENTAQKGKPKTPPGVWRNDPDPMRIASLCELYFEWGVKDVILHRFRTVLWPGIVCRAVRRVVIEEDTRRRTSLNRACYYSSGEADGDDPTDLSSPTKRISSTLSALTLSSPSKKSSAASISTADPSESFTLSSLILLTSPVSSGSSRSTPPSSPTMSTSRLSPLLLEVLSQRAHASTDSTLEYRVLVDPTVLVERAESGVRGIRPPLVGGLFGTDSEEDGSALDQDADEIGSDDAIERLETAAGAASKLPARKRKARRKNPMTPLRLWLPACMVRTAAPALADAYEEKVKARVEKKTKQRAKARRGGRGKAEVGLTSKRTKAKSAVDGDDDGFVSGPSSSKIVTGSKTRSKTARADGGRGRGKRKQASEAQDDAYEFIDLSAGEGLYPSDGKNVKENSIRKGKERAKMGEINRTKPTTKGSVNTSAASEKMAATNPLNEFFNTAKPSTLRAIKSKSSIARSPGTKRTPSPAASKCAYEEEDDSEDAIIPPPLPKSSRPLDLLRVKPKAGTAAPSLTSKVKSKTTAVPRYEEEESSSSEPHSQSLGIRSTASKLSCLSAQPPPHARKRSSFVDVSDTESDVEASNARRPSTSMTASIVAWSGAEANTGIGNGGTRVSASDGTSLSTFASKSMDGVIDLIAKGNASRSRSKKNSATVMPTVSHPSVRPASTPSDMDMNGLTPIARSSSKLAHIFLPPSQLALESQEQEGSEGDELPTYHRGSAKWRTKKTSATAVRPAPQPFPMQFGSESSESSYVLRLRKGNASRHDERDSDDDVIKNVDVFRTPHRSSPPCSPTPSPPPVKPLPIHASVGPAALVKSKQSGGFPASPTGCESQINIELHKKTKQNRHVSSDCDTHASGNEKNGILKSPRKSAAHSSPRHDLSEHGRTLSPTPLAFTHSVSDEGYNASDSQLRPESSGLILPGADVGRKPRPSDAFAIYISSGSEGEGNARPNTDDSRDIGGAEVSEDHDVSTDLDADGWADKGTILSASPSPARTPHLAARDSAPTVPAAEATLFNRSRVSKFKSAPIITSKLNVRAPSGKCRVSGRVISARPKGSLSDEDNTAPRSVYRAPLLAARAKQGKGRDDVIDLTSD